jgi:DNA repair protein RadC
MKTFKTKMDLISLKRVSSDFPKCKITSSLDAYNNIKQFYFDDIDIFESFFILLLNRSNNTIGYAKISQGGIAGTVVDVKLIAKYAVEALASSVILAHNHPSGNINPSDQDKKITTMVVNALKLFEINCLDHLIIIDNNYYSFADNGNL